MFGHGGSRLAASGVMGWLQLACAEAPLHMPRGVATPTGKTRGASFYALPAGLRLRNGGDNTVGGRWA